MKTILHHLVPKARKACLVFAALLLANLLATVQAEDNTLTPAETAEGWKLLFNGKSLAGWRGPGDRWMVQDGAITIEGSEDKPSRKSTSLTYPDLKVSDFVLTLKARVLDGKAFALGAIGFRVDFSGIDAEKMGQPDTGYLALLSARTGDFGRLRRSQVKFGGGVPNWPRGSRTVIRDAAETGKWVFESGGPIAGGDGSDKPVISVGSEWVDYKVIAEEKRLQFFQNGKQSADLVDESAGSAMSGGLLLFAYFDLKRTVQFKDIKLKELVGSSSPTIVQKSIPPAVTGPGQLKVLSDQFPQAKEWVLARLDLSVPGNIGDKVGALKATLAAESVLNAQDKEAQDSYKLGIGLCDALNATLKLREQAYQQAGGSAVRAPSAGGIQQWDRSTKVYGEQLGAAYAKLAATLTARNAKPFIVSASTPAIVFPPFAASPAVPVASIVPNSPSTPTPVTAKAPSTSETPKPDDIVGRWRLGNSIIVLADEGTFENSAPNYHEKGRWTRVGTATPPRYKFDWSYGRKVEEYYLSGDQLKRKTAKGLNVVGNRVK